MNDNNHRNNNNQDGYHYYSYGKHSYDSESDRENRAESSSMHDNDVEMTPPRELKTFPVQPPQPQIQRQWSYGQQTPPKRSSFRSVFLSFLAGAVVVGSLMFASDRLNLFSGKDVIAAGAAAAPQGDMVSGNGGSSSSTTTAALDLSRPSNIADMVKKASPAVVKIQTYAKQRQRGSNSLFDDPLFREFFGFDGGGESQQQQPNNDGQMVQVGSGSGFFFEKDGYILTNEHVVDGADEVKVVVEGDKEPYTAKVLGTAYQLDLAVLKVDGNKDFPVLPLGDSQNIRVGDWVVAIGNPYEFEHTVTVGVLSAKEREISIPDSQGTRNYQALLQTDASINPGNSGGPLLNLSGEVIGINTAVNAQAQGIGFAIPTSTIADVLQSLKENKEIPRPYIGIKMENVPEQYVDDLGLTNSEGAFVREVLFGSPAYKAGIQVYDVILNIDGTPIKDIDQLSKQIAKKKPGEKAALKVMRNGKEVAINLTIGDMNDQKSE
jgi:serine protease Do